MNEKLTITFIVCLLTMILSGLCLAIGGQTADKNMKQQAVDAGKAVWVVDQKTAYVQFQWKP